jgi:hypothetical protein
VLIRLFAFFGRLFRARGRGDRHACFVR